jgi:putative SOS response-associated peptidase YedK
MGTTRGAADLALPRRSVTDDAFYEWMLSDHPLAAAERERRREEHYLRRHEQRALIRRLVDEWSPEASERLFALRESMGRFADRWERVCDEWQEGERVDDDAVRARFTLQQRDGGHRDYRYPQHYLGPRAAASPPPSPAAAEAAAGEEPWADAVCARLAQTSDGDFLYERFGVQAGAVEARPEVAPAQPLTVVHRVQGRSLAAQLPWGLTPPDAAGEGWARPRLTEAPAETALDDPVLAAPVRRQRVIVPVDGVDGWGRGGGPALSVRRHDRDVLCLAGVWERGRDPVTGAELTGVAVLTVDADARMRRRGPRMPLALDPDEEADWLDAAIDLDRLSAILTRPRSSLELSVAAPPR